MITIIRATPAHSVRLTQIAHAAKSYWGYPAHWIELWKNQLTITAKYIEESDVFAALDDDDIVLGFYSLVFTGTKACLDHLWVMPFAFRNGIGRTMFGHAVELAIRHGATIMEIESDPNAEGFYERLGARTVGEVTYEMDGVPRSLPLMEMRLTPGEAPSPADA